MKSRNLYFLSSNSTGTGRLFLEKAVQMGFIPWLVCHDPERFPFVSELPVHLVLLDAADETAVLAFLAQREGQDGVAGVLSTSEYYQPIAARAARALGRPGGDPTALETCRDKAQQRRRLRHAGVPQPRFAEAGTVNQALVAAQDLGGIVVLKPVQGSGSVGVQLARTRSEVEAVAGALLGRTHNERGLPIEQRILVEEFVAGPEFSVELFHGRSIGVTQKLLGQPPFFVEVGHTFPAPVSHLQRGLLEQTAVDAVQALGLGFGSVHVEVKLTEGGAAIIEVNGRLAGGYIPRIIELTGTDLISATIAAATDSQPLVPETRFGAAAIRFLLPAAAGTLKGVAGLTEARSLPSVAEAMMYVPAGATVGLYGDFRDRIGHIIATADDPVAASAAAEAARAQIRIQVQGAREEQ